jgi:hypothetical protein
MIINSLLCTHVFTLYKVKQNQAYFGLICICHSKAGVDNLSLLRAALAAQIFVESRREK